jgi:hypothetical protein
MRSVLVRLAALGAVVAVVASCDAGLPTTGQFNNGGGNPGSPNPGGPGTSLSIAIDSPLVGSLVNVGDSVLVTVHLHTTHALKSATIVGVSEKGSVDLGTFSQTPRYAQLSVPAAGSFRAGLRDTTIRRYLQPISQADTSTDSLIVLVAATDSSGAADTASTKINIVSGPRLDLVTPAQGDSIPGGASLSVTAHALSTQGVNRIDIRVQGEATWPTKFDTTISQIYFNGPRDVTFATVAKIPTNAPVRGRITVTATATDINRQPGSASPITAFVRSANSSVPRVTQTVSPKSEFSDSVSVRATGDGIAHVGLIIRDTTGTIVQTNTVDLPSPFNANIQANVALKLAPTLQGKRLGITAFAVDQGGKTGYAVSSTQVGTQDNVNLARVDSTLVVYGQTFPLPHTGTIGDIAVDAGRGNVFLSNTNFNLLELWHSDGTTKSFSPNGIPVGSLPWGLFISNNPDTLLVANSGGTNISRVFIGSADPGQIHEDLPNRILTRNSYVYQVTVEKDENTGKIRLSALGPISYSDRPQYIAQSKGGRVYYSTRPTATAPAGTMRWLDPSLPVPDPRQVWQYGSVIAGTVQTYALFNVDSIAIGAALPTSQNSDTLFIWDHPYGQRSGVIAVHDTIPTNAIAQAVAGGSDAELQLRLDITSLGLTDTTFVAASGNRNWIAFGEGHKTGAGRVVMVADSTPNGPNFFSPPVTIADLTDNASEQVFGLALDLSGNTVASHGTQSYFASVSDPFHLRLQGKYDSFDDGAGVVFHPAADGPLTPEAQRLAFVGARSGVIEVVDVAYYVNRARLQLKNPIYGPLRASLPMPGDPPDVVLKLYAVSDQGLVVVNLTANDIRPGP